MSDLCGFMDSSHGQLGRKWMGLDGEGSCKNIKYLSSDIYDALPSIYNEYYLSRLECHSQTQTGFSKSLCQGNSLGIHNQTPHIHWTWCNKYCYYLLGFYGAVIVSIYLKNMFIESFFYMRSTFWNYYMLPDHSVTRSHVQWEMTHRVDSVLAKLTLCRQCFGLHTRNANVISCTRKQHSNVFIFYNIVYQI